MTSSSTGSGSWTSDYDEAANSHVAPFDAAFPGTLPVRFSALRFYLCSLNGRIETKRILRGSCFTSGICTQIYSAETVLVRPKALLLFRPSIGVSNNATLWYTRCEVSSFSNSNCSFGLAPISKGGSIFLPKSQRMVRINQIQLEQVCGHEWYKGL